MRFDVGLPLSVQTRWVEYTPEQPVCRHQRKGIPVLRRLVAFNAVTKMKRLIKSTAFVSSSLNEGAALCAALSRSHLRSMTEVSALNSTTKHPLGLAFFSSQTPHLASLWLLSHVSSRPPTTLHSGLDTVWWHSPESPVNHSHCSTIPIYVHGFKPRLVSLPRYLQKITLLKQFFISLLWAHSYAV